MNKYYLTARLMPTILTSVPLCTMFYYFISPLIFGEAIEIKWLPVAGNVGFMAAIVFLLVQINRIISKEVFQRIHFQDEIKMPTTNYLLNTSNYFTEEVKMNLYNKIKGDFGMVLYDLQQEEHDENGARKRIIIAVSQIRTMLKGNAMLHRHNIEYGFARNLMGGCLLAVIISGVNILLFHFVDQNHIMFNMSIALGIVYLVPVLLSKFIVNRFGKYYSKILFEQYLATRK